MTRPSSPHRIGQALQRSLQRRATFVARACNGCCKGVQRLLRGCATAVAGLDAGNGVRMPVRRVGRWGQARSAFACCGH